ncbi:GTP-binding protein [Butyrivibrio sp. INlla16]|uniref:GTP-binding protein n=1 Tax=Butyrivibrio sp. INlla16 TaxID=1520807 RepID=UPI0008845A16|nr:GTP-binding protein [Butyrivibrio sp. INlla16]SDB32652.1 GTPase, G3E family [Butyrivibrio sp. INlla16]
MQILLISGFLGAGKTTFIKELIKRTDKRPVIMENEYGANNLDSLELQNASSKESDIKVLEFMEGCVCCTMKDSFVNSVLAIFSSLDPEYLIIEPTGVGKLSSIIENLKPVLNKVIFLLQPTVVISPLSFRQNMKEWPELYTDQIANAGRVVFSKCENADTDEIKKVTEEIRQINSKAEIISEHYSKMDDKWWDSLFQTELTGDGAVGLTHDNGDGTKAMTVSDETESGSSEVFSQVSIQKAGVHNPTQLVQLLEDCLRGEFGLVSRAKGTLWVGSEILRFDLADSMYAVTDSPDDNCQCVFIGKNLDEKKLKDRLIGSSRRTLK